ncbi:N-terminal C2 in EEIG1 and EHBP1 proteins domain containing protein [Elaphomyces granulatus]
MQAFVPKTRKPRFELTLRIVDLNNVPLVCGTSYIKWHLPSSTSAEHRGRTDRAVIQDHRALWDYEKVLPVRLTVDRSHMLQECEIHFEIFQEFSSGGRGDRILMGNIKLNLAEYVDKSDDDGSITRRYLMQDSKINSTLKIGIMMHLIEGDKNFVTPPLKTAMVFGGITSLMPSEHGDLDDLSRMPSINTSREVGDLQDMYRRTLAASWTCRSGELPPDQLIEDLFEGGAWWENAAPSSRSERSGGDEYDETASFSDTDSRKTVQGSRLSPTLERRPKASSRNHYRNDSKDTEDGIGGRGSIERQVYDTTKERRWRSRGVSREVSEFDVREDLRTWEIAVKD